MPDQPWHKLPAEVAAVLRPALDEVAAEIVDAVSTVPAYGRPMTGPFGEGVRIGVEEALGNFLAEIELHSPTRPRDVYRALGEGEMRSGRSLDALLSAYRVGARVAWRRFAAIGAQAGLEPDTLYLLAESIFAYIDVLSAESAEGYALAQSAAAGETLLRRRRLVRLLIREPPAEPDALRAAATEAGWELPRRAAALALDGPGRETVAAALPAGSIRATVGDLVCAIIDDPDGPGRRDEIARALSGTRARGGLGTAGDPGRLGTSFRHAQAALSLAEDGALASARDRAGELLLRGDPGLAAELIGDRLSPLEGLSVRSRSRMSETLRAWLAEQGRLAAVAERLSIHPQTARYRLGRLRELFGAALDDPEQRFWLEVALRVKDDR